MLIPTRPIPRFADGHVRSKAVEWLSHLGDDDICDFLPQLVQVCVCVWREGEGGRGGRKGREFRVSPDIPLCTVSETRVLRDVSNGGTAADQSHCLPPHCSLPLLVSAHSRLSGVSKVGSVQSVSSLPSLTLSLPHSLPPSLSPSLTLFLPPLFPPSLSSSLLSSLPPLFLPPLFLPHSLPPSFLPPSFLPPSLSSSLTLFLPHSLPPSLSPSLTLPSLTLSLPHSLPPSFLPPSFLPPSFLPQASSSDVF